MKIKILKIDILILVLIIPFIIPSGNIKILENVLKIWKMGTGLWAIIYIFRKRKTNTVLLTLTAFYLIIVISGIIHKNSIVSVLNDIALLWIINYLTESKEIRNRTLIIFEIIMTFVVIANFITMVIYPNGMYKSSMYELNWLLGYKNIIIRKILPYIVVILLNIQNRKMKLYEKIGIICSIGSIALSQSVNGYIGLGVFGLSYIIMCKKEKISNIITLTKVFSIYSFVDFLILFTNTLANFNGFINEKLNKYASMSGRLAIWELTIKAIAKTPIIGYGAVNSTVYDLSFNITHPHNLLLYYLMLGGITCVIAFFIALGIIDKNKNKEKCKTNIVFIASYISYFSMALTESLMGATFFIPFLLVMYNINKEETKRDDRHLYTIQN